MQLWSERGLTAPLLERNLQAFHARLRNHGDHERKLSGARSRRDRSQPPMPSNMDAGSMVARADSAQHKDRANSDPGCPVQNQDFAPSEIHTIPLMMRCSCKCGCRRVRAKLNICSKCNNIVCHANCCLYFRCHWCFRYPEDTPQHCFACAEDYPRSDQRCRRCRAFFVRGMLQTR